MESTPCNEGNNIIEDLNKTLQKDLLACDLKYCLFNAAVHNMKPDSCLKPFPPMFRNNGQTKIDELIQLLDEIPPLTTLCESKKLPSNEQEFLQWLLTKSDVTLTTIHRSRFYEILDKPGLYNRKHNILPSYIFEVTRKPNSVIEKRFQGYSEEFGSKFAFHGSKTSNFYSIVNHGLQQHLNKTSVFGEGKIRKY
jgi:poly [ADP-ribose] polymerase 16